MLDKFITELEEILHSTPYSGVDVLPLIEKYTDDKDSNETSIIRLRIRSIIDQLVEQGLVQGGDYHFQLATKFAGQYSQEPILLKSTLKFEQQYNDKRKPPVQPITNNIINADKNRGNIVQSSFNTSSLNETQSDPKKKLLTTQSAIKKIITYLGQHITEIIIGIIVLVIGTWLCVKFGILH